MKYIDTKKLIAEIEAREKVHFEDYHIKKSGGPADYGAANALHQLLFFIDSLQQEQPDVDLEEVFEKEYSKFSNDTDAGDYALPIDLTDYKDFARHFYELGLNARKEE